MARTRERTRPDTSREPAYVTAEGYERLDQEARYLWTQKRPEVVKALTAAAEEGDRSENAEYIYRKRQLAEIDRRLRFLGARLDVLKIAQGRPADQGRVTFGCYVTVEDQDGVERRYRIVGPDEWDASRGDISMHSPIGAALLGKRLDDEVEVETPNGKSVLTIVTIAERPS
ncbi:MAG: transcription elongation factor GreB [Myxococcota bacterium]|jgi:transcription elongation factor GreB|nr:transcription elongation factor GreB [Myxococcota bacterium]